MPFYEYQCQACGAQLEVMQKINDAQLRKCPECGKNQLRKLVSAPVFRLKGGGWYETDFKTDKDNKRNLVDTDKGEAKPAEKSAEKPEVKGETKSDTKSDAKPEAKVESRAEPKPAAQPVKKKVAKSKGKARR